MLSLMWERVYAIWCARIPFVNLLFACADKRTICLSNYLLLVSNGQISHKIALEGISTQHGLFFSTKTDNNVESPSSSYSLVWEFSVVSEPLPFRFQMIFSRYIVF